jgi:hypothetical protein
MLADALVQEYINYYGPNGATYKENIKKKKTFDDE